MASRILRDSIKTSPTLDALSAQAEVLFHRAITWADDRGRIESDPRLVLSGCFPLKVDRLEPALIEKWLQELVSVDAIRLYFVGGRRFGYFPTWLKHQRAPRYTKSKFPAPEEADIQTLQAPPGEVRTVPDSSRRRRAKPPVVRSTQLGGRGTKYEGRGKRVKGETRRSRSFKLQHPQTNDASRGNGKSTTPTAEQRLLIEQQYEVIRHAPAALGQAVQFVAKKTGLGPDDVRGMMREIFRELDRRAAAGVA